MDVTLTIPESIFARSGGEVARALLERASLEAFRVGTISLGRLAELLDLTIDETHGFLKLHTPYSAISQADIDEGRATLATLLNQ